MPEPGRVGILISGRGSNMVSLVESLRADAPPIAEPAVVISNRRTAAGLARAAELGVPTEVLSHRGFASRGEHELAIIEVLERHDVGLVCLAGYMRLLTSTLVEAYRNRILNIHPSLLPAFPGLRVHEQALDYGVKVAGCTVHFVDEACDHGPIVVQAAVPVKEIDDADSLAARILEQEHRIYPEAVRLFFQDRLQIEGRCVRVLPAA